MLSQVLMLTALTVGGWGAGGCGPVGPRVAVPVQSVTTGYEWRHTDGDDWHYLFRAGSCIGAWNEKTDDYRPYDPATGTWKPAERPPWKSRQAGCACCPACGCGEECHCAERGPCTPDCKCTAKQTARRPADVENFGVMCEKLQGGGERFTLSGKAVTGARARDVLAGRSVPDDAGKLRLTVIGPEADRQRVLDDLEKSPALAAVRDRFVVQSYPPDHWAVAGCGFVTDGKPTIYLQAPDGQVLHRQNDYSGPDELAGAVRRADPNYDARRDPDQRPAELWKRFRLAHVPVAAWLLVGAGLFLLLRKGIA